MGKAGLILVAVLLAGCVKPQGNYCDLTTTLYFDEGQVVDYLAENDDGLLKEIVIHNETRARLCG